MTGRTFDWRPQRDERSRAFMFGAPRRADLRTHLWRCEPRLNQGEAGACVGFALTHLLAASPDAEPTLDAEVARDLYERALTLDEWPGEDYSGTSVLAGLKAAKVLGFVSRYEWIETATLVLMALSHRSPVVLGCWWRESMLDAPSEIEAIPVEGAIVGGHAVCLHGIHLGHGLVRIRNSWGEGWGRRGDCFVTLDGLRTLLADAEAAVVDKMP